MEKSSCLFWFSGTGNSLYAAKRLSAGLGNLPLVRITDEAPPAAVGGEGEKIGFVFPSYYGNLPRIVRAFVEKLEVEPGTYIFAVVTMGALGQGSVAALEKALKAKNLRLHYGRGILMPANYVIKYNPADSAKSEKTLEKKDKRLQKYAGEIAARAQSVKALPVTADNLYRDIEMLDAMFTANESCTSCGLCERICPARNIRLPDGKPEWLHRCEHCVACISWCPARAIEYGALTQSRRRYQNRNIKADELMRPER